MNARAMPEPEAPPEIYVVVRRFGGHLSAFHNPTTAAMIARDYGDIEAGRYVRQAPVPADLAVVALHVLRALMESRCYACNWRLAPHQDKGCVPFNCSFRPDERDQSYRAWHARATAMERLRTRVAEIPR